MKPKTPCLSSIMEATQRSIRPVNQPGHGLYFCFPNFLLDEAADYGYSKRDLSYSSFEWNGCQGLFEQSKSDVLLLLDCCCAAAAATCIPSRTTSITETIGACGWETWAPEPGSHSFTNALIEVLEDWIDRKSFSAAMLHSEILSVLKQSRPRYNREISKTPVYIVTTSNPKTCSIEISRRTQPDEGPTSSGLASSREREDSPTTCSNISVESDLFDLSALIDTLPDKTFLLPHVIISVALETDQALDMKSFEAWVKQFPALATYAKIQGVYKGYSTLVLLALPIVIWNLLPEDPACNFVGYVRTDNLLDRDLQRHNKSTLEENQVVTQLKFSERVPPIDATTWKSLYPVSLLSSLQQRTTHHRLPPTSASIQSALKEQLDLDVKDFALILIEENGNQQEFTSHSLAPYHHRVFSENFQEGFRRSLRESMRDGSSRDPYDSEAYANSGVYHLRFQLRILCTETCVGYASDTSSVSVKTFQRPRPRGRFTQWGDLTDDVFTPMPVPVKKTRQLQIGNEDEVGKFYSTRFKDMRQSACKVMAGIWVKLLEPKQQTHHPYTKGDESAPPWWPPTTGVNHVRYKETNRLLKPGKKVCSTLIAISLTFNRTGSTPSSYPENGR